MSEGAEYPLTLPDEPCINCGQPIERLFSDRMGIRVARVCVHCGLDIYEGPDTRLQLGMQERAYELYSAKPVWIKVCPAGCLMVLNWEKA